MCKRIGIDHKELRLHDARHEFGSTMVDKEVDFRISAASMGHTDLRSQKRYQHPDLVKFAKKMRDND